MTKKEIERRLFVIRSAAPRMHDRRGRFAAEHYLAEVFRLYRKLKHRDDYWNAFHRYVNRFDLRLRKAFTISQILALTCDAPPKMKSRWYRAIRYAWSQRRAWDDFIEFMRTNGGPSGCASKWADLQPPRTPRGYARVGDPGMPPIPLFVDPIYADHFGIPKNAHAPK
ncbi:MAG: hypothetical protein AB1490_05360 [Pseudomonadota bacterium]